MPVGFIGDRGYGNGSVSETVIINEVLKIYKDWLFIE